MSTPDSLETVRFTTKGQVVIPLRIRKELLIERGTRASVELTSEGILLKPFTLAAIRNSRGILKRHADQKPLAEEWAEHKREERGIEEAKHGLNRPR